MRRLNPSRVTFFVLGGALGVLALVALLLCGIFAVRAGGPIIKVQNVEPANVLDDAGAELLLVSLSVSNCAVLPNEPIYVNDSSVSLEAKVANHWVPLEGHIGLCALRPIQDSHRVDIVVPANATACRVNFKWAHARLIGGRMRWIAEQGWFPAKISTRLWKMGWGGFPRYRPSSHWQETAIELPIVHGKSHGNA